MPKSSAYPDLERAPGKKDNWVEAVGGLPRYIERIAKHLHYERGHPISAAIAMAVNTVKRWATGTNHNGGKLKPDTVAKAQAAVAEWESKKARANAKRLKEWGEIHIAPDEAKELAEALSSRLVLVEGVELGLDTAAGLANAKALLEAGDSKPKLTLTIGKAKADPEAAERMRRELAEERDEIAALIDALTAGALDEARRGQRRGGPVPGDAPAGPGEPQDAMMDEPLAVGAEGERVMHLQNRLNSLGHGLKPDGSYGEITDAAVRAFQEKHGLMADGMVGPITADMLRSAPDPETEDEIEVPAEEVVPVEEPGELPEGEGEGELPAAETPEEDAAPDEEVPEGDIEPDEAPTTRALPQSQRNRTLHKGIGVGEHKSNPAVRAMQGQLNGEGFNVDEDGRFGPETEKAVKRFQRRWGLKTDGIVGPKTHRTLKGVQRKRARMEKAKTRRLAASAAGNLAEANRLMAEEQVLARQLAEGRALAEVTSMAEADPWGGKPGPNAAQVGPAARKKLSPLIKHYMKKPHPFTSCVRDNTKRFGPDRAKRVCAVLKDIGRGTTKWRKGGNKKLSEAELIETIIEELIEAGMDTPESVDLIEAFMISQDGELLEESALASIEEIEAVEEATLTAKGRKAIDTENFALPGRRYPIHDLAHARNALARVAQNGTDEEKAKVRAAVYRKYPALKKRVEEGVEEREYAAGAALAAGRLQEGSPHPR